MSRLVQARCCCVGRDVGPEQVQRLLAMEPPAVAESQQLHQLDGVAAVPGLGRDSDSVQEDLETAEQPHLDAHVAPPDWARSRG